MEKNGLYGMNFCTTNSLLTATGAETVHDTTVLLNYAIGGKAYTKSGTNADQVTPTVDGSTGLAFTALTANKACAMVWCYNSAGAVKVVQGPVVNWNGTAFEVPPTFPAIPDTLCPFAYQILKAGSTAGTIQFGTTNWNATGFTNVIQNVLVLPDRPQIA
ncbi:MAG TPA: hypothetical protein VIT92_07130 [Burkholderiaceae bacterium]